MASKLFAPPRVRAYVIDPGGVWTCVSYVFMVLSSLLRLLYFLRVPQPVQTHALHLLLPLAAVTVFVCTVAFLGERTALPSAAGVLLGVIFFALKAQAFAPLHRVLCTILYAAVIGLYTLTVLGMLPTKKLLYPLFGLPFIYHLLVEDTRYYFFADPPVPVVEWLPEMSVLCIMAGLFFASVALQKTEN